MLLANNEMSSEQILWSHARFKVAVYTAYTAGTGSTETSLSIVITRKIQVAPDGNMVVTATATAVVPQYDAV